MPDYNLGRAHGEIEITADTRGAVEAQSAMAATAAEARGLDATMGRVNDQFARNQRQNVATAESITRHRQQVETLQRTYQRYFDEYQRATNKTKEAEDALARARRNENAETNVLLRLARDVEKSRDNEARLLSRVEQAHAGYENRLRSVTTEVARFNEAHIAASSGLNRMRHEAERVGEALESLSGKMSSILRVVGTGGIMGLFGLGSAGSTAALGASGLSGITSLMSGVIEMVQQLSGVVALLPAAIGGGVVALGTLAAAFEGVGASMSAMMDADPRKFLESLKELAPAARQAMVTFYSFQDAIRGVQHAIQEATFEPFVAQIQPLLYTWLPLLQEGGKQIGHMFGEMASQVATFLQTASAQQGFQTFIANMSSGLQAASGAIQPLLQAFQTLSVVGSSFFSRIGNAITQVAGEFNRWVEGAASTGKLQAWISAALTGFTNLAHAALNVTEGIANFFAIGDKYGGGFLQFIERLSQEFVNWTNSAKGIETISSFFQLIHAAGQAITPILKLVGEGFATIAGALTRLGIEIAPGVQSFFGSIVQALHILAPIIQQAGPSINTFLTEFGKAIVSMVQQAGPELPKIFQGLTQALLELLPVLPKIVEGVASILDHLTPNQIEGIFLAAIAIKGMTAAFGLLTLVLDANPIMLVIGAIGLLSIGVAAAITNFHGFGDAVANALHPLEEIAGKAYDWGKNLLSNFINGISAMLQPLDNVAGTVANTISDLWKPGSPTKRGPLSDISTEEMGSRLVGGYASGIAGGTSGVEGASSGVAGAVAGTTGLGFTSAGASGKSGVGVSGEGKSGFDQYISFLTKDLTAWNNIFRESFGLFQTTANTIVQTIKVTASLWNGGDNPLTRPGGIAGPPVAWGQQQVPGVQNVQAPGHAPLPNLVPQGAAGASSQQQVPGVQNVGPQGRPRPGEPGFIGPVAGAPPANPPASTTGQVSASSGAPPIIVGPNGTITSPNPEWQKLITRESGGRNVLQGDIPGDPNTGPNKAQGYFQITPDTWRGNGGEQFAPSPMQASPQQQAIVAGRIFAARGGQPWGAVPGGGREDPNLLRAGLTPAVAPTSTGQGTGGLPPGTPTPDSAMRGVNLSTIPVAVQKYANDCIDASARIILSHSGVNLSEDQLQGAIAPGTNIQTQAAGLNKLLPQGQFVAMPGSGGSEQAMFSAIKASIDRGVGSILNVAPGSSIAGRNFGEGHFIAVTGYNPDGTVNLSDTANGKQYSVSAADAFQATQGRGIVAGTGTGPPPTGLGGNAPANPPASTVGQVGGLPVPGLPNGPSQRLGSGLHLPGVGALGAALGAGVGGIGAIGAYRIGRAGVDAYRQATFDQYDARAQLDVIRSLSPEDAASIGRNHNITFGEPGTGLQGLNVNLGGVPPSEFSRLSPEEQLRVGRDLQAYRGAGVRGGISGGPTGVPPSRPPASIAGADGPSVLGRAGRAAGGALDAAAIPLLIGQAGQVSQQQRAGWLGGGTAVAGTTILGGAALAAGSAAGAGLAPTFIGAGALGALATATGSATGQESTQTPGVIYGPNGQVISAGPQRTGTAGAVSPNPPASRVGQAPSNAGAFAGVDPNQLRGPITAGGPGPTAGLTGLDKFGQELVNRRAAIGADTSTGLGGPSGSQPVHVTNPNDLPGGLNAPPPTSTQPVKPTDAQQPLGPPGPGLFGGRQGDIRPGQQQPANVQGQLAPAQQAGAPGSNVDYKTLYDPNNNNQGKLPFNAETPLQSFESGLASVGNIASDAFTIFNDVIQNISATAAITDTLVRGVANTEDVVGIIKNFQTYIKTAADVAHLVGDVGGMAGGASGGMDMGGGAALQAIAGLVSSALEGVNQAITLGIDVYHEVGKYAGFIMGGFLGGENTGPLGGNVRMILNTRTNQLQTYSDDNPLNKNYLSVPNWQRSYNQQPTPPATPAQINYYAGPGDSPQQFMSNAMYMSNVGGAPVASVSGRD